MIVYPISVHVGDTKIVHGQPTTAPISYSETCWKSFTSVCQKRLTYQARSKLKVAGLARIHLGRIRCVFAGRSIRATIIVIFNLTKLPKKIDAIVNCQQSNCSQNRRNSRGNASNAAV
jgi:hypothetical protein